LSGDRVARDTCATWASSTAIWTAEVTAADDDDALSGVRLGPAVRGGVQQLAVVGLHAGQLGDLRDAEQPGCGDDRSGGQLLTAGQLDDEPLGVPADCCDSEAGADRKCEVVNVLPQVGGGLVAVRVPRRVAGERQAGQGAVPGRGEQGERVVEARPRPAGLLAGLEQGEAETGGAEGVTGGESGLAGADDDDVVLGHFGPQRLQ
jgi:hypothetical protein